jgi:hypothetical protein
MHYFQVSRTTALTPQPHNTPHTIPHMPHTHNAYRGVVASAGRSTSGRGSGCRHGTRRVTDTLPCSHTTTTQHTQTLNFRDSITHGHHASRQPATHPPSTPPRPAAVPSRCPREATDGPHTTAAQHTTPHMPHTHAPPVGSTSGRAQGADLKHEAVPEMKVT